MALKCCGELEGHVHVCAGPCACPGRTQQSPRFSCLANLKAHTSEGQDKHVNPLKSKVCLITHRDPQQRAEDFRFKALKENSSQSSR